MSPKPALATPRLGSVDAYRGLVMLAMASSAFSFMSVLKTRDGVLEALDGTRFAAWSGAWDVFYRRLCYQFDHVEWTGCGFWDLIQPSFMFLVGVALPFSFARREKQGESGARWFGHVLLRSLILVALGIFLSSTSSPLTNFTFMNVLAQIGLGYPLLCLLRGRGLVTLLVINVVILGGTWAAFSLHDTPESEREAVEAFIRENKKPEYQEMVERNKLEGIAAHWNMHTNLGASLDRKFLNLFPRQTKLKKDADPQKDEPLGDKIWRDRCFWINDGGYQTINFIPSLATMIFGLMAGKVLQSPRSSRARFFTLVGWAAGCFVLAMAVDTTIWPVKISGWDWSLCPAVKRLWTPTWAVFSAGWCFLLLAMFHLVIDIAGWRLWAWPLAVVGMNSIAMYVMAQTMKGWVGKMFVTHARALDAVTSLRIGEALTDEKAWTAPILMRTVEVALLWLICVWMYRRKIFIRV